MNEKQLEMYELFCELNGEQVADIFLNWHGTQLLTDAFYTELIEQGYIFEGDN